MRLPGSDRCALAREITARLSARSQPRDSGIPVPERDSFQAVALDNRAELPCDAKSGCIRDENGNAATKRIPVPTEQLGYLPEFLQPK